MKYKINVSKNISEIDSQKWDKIAQISLLKSETLKTIEGLALTRDVYYVEIYDETDKNDKNGKEKLIAVAAFYGQSESLYASLDESLYGKYTSIAKPVFGLNPSLICHFPYSPFYKMFEISGNYDKSEIFNLISGKLKELAEDNGYKSYGFMGIEDEDLVNEKSGFMQFFSGFKTRIEIKGKSFIDHISNLEKKSERHTIRKDLNHLKEIPFRIERIKKLNKYEESIIDILNNNFAKYLGSKNNKEEITKEYINAFDRDSENITYFIGKLNDEIISAAMVIEDDTRIIGLRVGQIDEGNLGYPFFDLSIYEPTKYAIENSKKYIELGTGNYEYKIRRGATLSNCYNLIKSTNKFKNLYLHYIIPILDKRNRRKHLSRAIGGRMENGI